MGERERRRAEFSPFAKTRTRTKVAMIERENVSTSLGEQGPKLREYRFLTPSGHGGSSSRNLRPNFLAHSCRRRGRNFGKLATSWMGLGPSEIFTAPASIGADGRASGELELEREGGKSR